MASGSSSRGIILLLLTSGFFITGLIFDYMPMIIDDHIKRTIELATNDEILSFWSKPPVDVHSYYWLYDVLNAEQFKNGDRVQVQKVGPFQFSSRMEKRIIELSANKYRIVYNSTRITRLNESFAGNDKLDDQLTLLNPIYAAITEGSRVHSAQMEAQQANVIMGTVNRLTERYNESLFMNATARQALMGRAMPIVAKMRKIAETFGLDSQVPDLVPNGKFGYVALTNATWMGPYEVYTGYQETAKSLGELISYQGKRRLTYYEGKCNRLQASAGELRPMPVDGSQSLEMFAPNFCRIVHLKPTGVHKLREGIGYSYVLASEDFASAEANPDNRCYCINGTADDHCSLSGTIELAPCSYSAPLLVTVSNITPDPKILNSIQNWDPDLLRSEVDHLATNDMVQIMILRRFGVPVFADLTATLFAKVTRDARFKHTANVPEVSYIPLVMIRETATIPQRFAQIMVNLESFLALTYHIKVIMYLSALVLLCWLTGYYYCVTSQSDRVVPVSRQTRSGSGAGGAPGSGGGGGADERSGSMGAALPNSTAATANSAATLGRRPRATPAGENPRTEDNNNSKDSGNNVELDDRNNNHDDTQQIVRNSAAETNSIIDKRRQQQQQPDTASSERANSADSSRSQPPSRRASRLNSLETSAGGNFSQDEPTNAGAAEPNSPNDLVQQQREAAQLAASSSTGGPTQTADERRPETLVDAAGGRSYNDKLEANNGSSSVELESKNNANGVGAARIFSKVDDELAGKRAGKQRQQQQQMAELPTNKREAADTDQDVGGAPDGPWAATSSEQQQQQQADDATEATRKRSRKNWFMNVYSGFVRMLHGIRTTISDVGQLDISENDYQDKQLEMLAGKIDNWYTSQPSPSPDAAKAGEDDQQPTAAGATTEPSETTDTTANRAEASSPGDGAVTITTTNATATTTAAETPAGSSGNVADSSRPLTRIARSPLADKEAGAPEVAESIANENEIPDGGDKQQRQQQQQRMMAGEGDAPGDESNKYLGAATADSNNNSEAAPGSVESSAEVGAAAGAPQRTKTIPTPSAAAGDTPSDSQRGAKEIGVADQMLKHSAINRKEEAVQSEGARPGDKQQQFENTDSTTTTNGGKLQKPGERQRRHEKSLQTSGKVVQESVERNDGVVDDNGSSKSPGDINKTDPSATPSQMGNPEASEQAPLAEAARATASISSRSATSDKSDELASNEDTDLEANCKASALEQIEAALTRDEDNKTATGQQEQQRPLAASGIGADTEERETIPGGEDDAAAPTGEQPDHSGKSMRSNGRPTMINSSTSIDSVINLAAANSSNVAWSDSKTKTTNNMAMAGGAMSGSGNLGADQSGRLVGAAVAPVTKLNGPYQIDESSSRVGSPMNLQHYSSGSAARWAPNGSSGGAPKSTGNSDNRLTAPAHLKLQDSESLGTATGTIAGEQPTAAAAAAAVANRANRATTLEQSSGNDNNNTMTKANNNNNELDERLDETHQAASGSESAEVDDDRGQLFAKTTTTPVRPSNDHHDGAGDNRSLLLLGNKKSADEKNNEQQHESGDGSKLDSRNGISENNGNGNELRSIGPAPPPPSSNGQVASSLKLAPLASSPATSLTKSAAAATTQGQQQIGLATNGRALTPANATGAQSQFHKKQQQQQQIKGKLTSETNNYSYASNGNGYNSVTISNQSPIQLINANGAKLVPHTNGNNNSIGTTTTATIGNNGNNNILNGKVMFQQHQQQQRMQDSLARNGTVIV